MSLVKSLGTEDIKMDTVILINLIKQHILFNEFNYLKLNKFYKS
jgi:hypothetical protein